MLMIENIQRIDLGIQGENLARGIQIDCNAWKELLPECTISIYHQRSGDTALTVTGAAYDDETGILTWRPTGTDTFYAGEGAAEIRATVNYNAVVDGETVVRQMIKKSVRIPTLVHHSLVNDIDEAVDSDWESYIAEVERLKNATQLMYSSTAAIKESADEALEQIANDTEAAGASSEAAEAWAVGNRNNIPVGNTDVTYHNNSKYYAEAAESSANQARGYASGASASAGTAGSAASAAQSAAANAASSASAANSSAGTAQTKASSASTSAAAAQSYAQNAGASAAAASQAAEAAQTATAHSPRLNSSNRWEVWDAETGAYVDTGVSANTDVFRITLENISSLPAIVNCDAFTAETVVLKQIPENLDVSCQPYDGYMVLSSETLQTISSLRLILVTPRVYEGTVTVDVEADPGGDETGGGSSGTDPDLPEVEVDPGGGTTGGGTTGGDDSGGEGLPADGPGVDPDPNAPVTEDPGDDEGGSGTGDTDPGVPEVEADP